MCFLKKKKIQIGEFVTDNVDDFGIAKYYEKKCTFLEKENWKLYKEIARLKKELQKTTIVCTKELEVRDINKGDDGLSIK